MPREGISQCFLIAENFSISSHTTHRALSISIPSFLICWTTVTPAYSYIAFFMIEHGLPCHELERPRSYISESGSLFIPTCIASEHVLYFEHFNMNDQWSIMVSCQANLNSSFQLLFNDIFVLRSCLDRLPMGVKGRIRRFDFAHSIKAKALNIKPSGAARNRPSIIQFGPSESANHKARCH